MNPEEKINEFPEEEMLPTKPKPKMSKTEFFILLIIGGITLYYNIFYCSSLIRVTCANFYGISQPVVNFKVSR
jgi:hypothetical protein